ncbi:uncharacterized protein LOC141656226 [Silene latifolia]|uniref:uncharacterized protein LOC141656226 n=1 Tax=Silene latifolia TaxID=37657 RepID=UPI003D778496
MNEPIIYQRFKCKPLPKEPNLSQRLQFALQNDDKDEFMRLIKHDGFPELRQQPLTCFTRDIFVYDALEIAIAVFNGETKGIIDMEHSFKDGFTPLHFATFYHAPRLTNFLLHRGDNNVDVTPFDFAFDHISYSGSRKSLFEMFTWLFYHHRCSMEVIRIIVLNMQNTKRVRERFVKYAHEGQVNNLAVLFMAVPELFLSSQGSESSLLSELKLELNPLVNNNKDIEKQQMSLLLDIFAMVGHQLAAYIRLQQFCVIPHLETAYDCYDQSYLEMDFFLREVARKKPGVCSTDYYLRFFEADPVKYADDVLPDWDDFTSQLKKSPVFEVFSFLPDLLGRQDFNRTDIYKLIPSLDSQSAARLNSAIENKLASMSSLHDSLETTAKISKEGGKHLPLGFPIVFSKQEEGKHLPLRFPIISSKQSLRTSMASAKPIVKFTPIKRWENKVGLEIKLKSFFSFAKLSHWAQFAKHLLK